MALASTKEGSPRRLGELLDEQQEPFVLEIYLLERGYRIRKGLELEGGLIGCCSSTITKNFENRSRKQFLKKSSSYHVGVNPVSKKSALQFSSMARTLLNKLVSRKGRKTRRKEIQVVESAGKCSTVSGSTTLSNNTWSESDTDGEIISMTPPATNKTTCVESAPDSVMTQWRFVEETKQYSPDSVLDEIDLLQAIPVYNVRQSHEEIPAESRKRFQRKASEDAIVSASLWELLVQLREKPNQQGKRKPFPEYMNSKKALQKNHQLMFDCVREVVENGKQQKSGRSSSHGEKGLRMGPDEIGKFICRNLKQWGKLSTHKTNIKKVLRMDLLGDEWSGFEVWKREIVAEIGNGIIDDITEQIIRDMIDQ